jgi:cytochrome P450
MNPDEIFAALLLTPEGRADPYVLYEQLRTEAPVFRSNMNLLVLARYDDCMAALRNPRLGRGLVGRPAPPRTEAGADPELRQAFFDRGGDSILLSDPPQHGRLRRLVSRAFTPNRVAALRPAVTGLVDRLLDDLEGEVDMLPALAFPLPNDVIGQLVGVPQADRAGFEQLVHTSSSGLEPTVDDDTLRAAMAAQDTLQAYFTELLAERRRRPAADLLTGLAAACDSDDRLTDHEITTTAILLFAAGFETTTNLIGNGLLALLTHPDQMERLRADPSLVPRAVEELLRWDSPVQINLRTALEDTEVAGEAVAAGQSVLILQGSANRDPERFPAADRLDVGRDDNVPLSFGWGAHHCLGAGLARLEGEVVFTALIRRFAAIELVDPAPAWRPGLLFRGLSTLPTRLTPV